MFARQLAISPHKPSLFLHFSAFQAIRKHVRQRGASFHSRF